MDLTNSLFSMVWIYYGEDYINHLLKGADLVLIRGLPGSGKSTFAQDIKRSFPRRTVHVEADQFFNFPGTGYEFNPSFLGDAHKYCQAKTKLGLEAGKRVIVSNTFTTMKEMKPYFKMAEELGLESIVICLKNDFGSVHNVPEESIARMRERWVDYSGETVFTLENTTPKIL